MSDIIDARGFPRPTGSVTDGRSIDGTVTIGAGFDDGRGHAVAYFGYRNTKPVLQRDRDYSACVLQNTGGGDSALRRFGNGEPGYRHHLRDDHRGQHHLDGRGARAGNDRALRAATSTTSLR